MIVTLVRHMETISNKNKILQGSSDAMLSEYGYAQSRKFAETVDFSSIDVIYSSSLSRAKHLATLISETHDITLKVDDRLKEISLGEWEGMTWEEVTIQYADFLKEWYKDNVNTKAPQGESYREFQIRVMQVINEINQSTFDNVLVVAHGAVIKTILCSILGMDLQNRGKFVIDNGSITTIEIGKYKSRLLEYNKKMI